MVSTMRTTTTPRTGYGDLQRLMALIPGDPKHPVGDTSTLDVIWTLYDRVLNVSPDTVDDPARDRFLLSKGHNPDAYYAVLAAEGFFPASWLTSVADFDSPLGRHPDRVLVPGVEVSSGSLGHGLPLGIGVAHGLRAQGIQSRVYVLIGDAELDEGSNHEAIAYAGAAGLELTVVVVDNQSATNGWPGGIARRFVAHGWSAVTVDGRDHDALETAFRAATPARSDDATGRGAAGRPHVVVARVVPKNA
jgi:transketolase